MSSRIITPVGVLSFPSLFTPRPIQAGGKLLYQASLIFDEDAQQTKAWHAMVDTIVSEAKGAFGDNVNLKSLKLPVKRCDTKAQYAGYDDPEGKFISCRSEQAPGIIDADKQDIFDATAVYPGCAARLACSIYTYDHPQGGKGVGLGLRNVQIINNDESRFPRLDGKVAADKDFDGADALDPSIVANVSDGGSHTTVGAADDPF